MIIFTIIVYFNLLLTKVIKKLKQLKKIYYLFIFAIFEFLGLFTVSQVSEFPTILSQKLSYVILVYFYTGSTKDNQHEELQR